MDWLWRWIKFTIRNPTCSTGAAIPVTNLLTDAPVLGNHEMKCVYPHYAYLYKVQPERMCRFIKAVWHAHIWDWPTLLFNRHGIYEAWKEKWDVEFEGSPLPNCGKYRALLCQHGKRFNPERGNATRTLRR